MRVCVFFPPAADHLCIRHRKNENEIVFLFVPICIGSKYYGSIFQDDETYTEDGFSFFLFSKALKLQQYTAVSNKAQWNACCLQYCGVLAERNLTEYLAHILKNPKLSFSQDFTCDLNLGTPTSLLVLGNKVISGPRRVVVLA